MIYRLIGVDTRALQWINSHHYRWLDMILLPISFVGEAGSIWIALSLFFMIFDLPKGARKTGLVLLATMIIVDFGIAAPLGHFMHRTRPYLALDGIRQVGHRWPGASFPSGHAHTVWEATVILSSRWKKLTIPLVIFALITCYTRIYFGMHYPIDVLGGALIGIAAGFAVVTAMRLSRRAAQADPQ